MNPRKLTTRILLLLVLMLCFGHYTGAASAAAIGSGSDQISQPQTLTQPDQVDVWLDRANELIPTRLSAAASDGTYLYVIGGHTYNDNPIAQAGYLQRYNPVANTWTRLADLANIQTTEGAACYMNGRIYYAGGHFNANITSLIRYYDIAANTWTIGPAYSGGSFAYASAACDPAHNKVYIIGGKNSSDYLNLNRVYNAANNTWEANAAPLPFVRSEGAAGLLSGERIIYAAGKDENIHGDTVIYTIATNIWTNVASLSNNHYDATYSVGADGKFYLAGGTTLSNKVDVYDPIANIWSAGPNLNHDISESAGAFVASKLYVVGGLGGTPNANCFTEGNINICNYNQLLDTDCPNSFLDINGNIFYGAIHNLSCRGVVNGTGPTTFGPAGTSTREQFAKVVTLGFGIPLANPQTPTFTDVPSNYFAYQFIEGGKAANILVGYSQAQCEAAGAVYPCFLPVKPITRAELTSLVVKAAGYTIINPAQPSFSDVPTNFFAYQAIETAYAKGVINGTGNGQFSPNVNIRRDQMCQILYKGITTF